MKSKTCLKQPGKRNAENIFETSLPFSCATSTHEDSLNGKIYIFSIEQTDRLSFSITKKTRSYERKKRKGIRSSHMYLNYL